ncbi:MAG TPA: hypothetical protein V6C97_00300 [Oculatellaceae cyanobacterium]
MSSRLRIAAALPPLVAILPLSLNIYAAWWAVNYRLSPKSDPIEYPQDHLERLKQLNTNISTESVAKTVR